MIHFTKHAIEKFQILENHSFSVSRSEVVNAIANPDFIDHSRLPLLIAQKDFDEEHVLRVVYRIERGVKIVITFYPRRKTQYGE